MRRLDCDRMVVGFTISAFHLLELWVQITLVVRCTRYNFMC